MEGDIMPRKCTICEYEHVEDINKALIEGQSLRSIAKQFDVSDAAVFRHKDHLPNVLRKAQEAEQVAQADLLLEQVQELQQKAVNLLEQAEKAGELKTALQGIKEARGCVELLAKLQGELAQEGIVSVTLAPEWLELRGVILQALEPYPEARERLTEAIERVENNAGK